MGNKYRLKIFPLAQADMENIFAYIAEELKNPTAAIDQINNFEKYQGQGYSSRPRAVRNEKLSRSSLIYQKNPRGERGSGKARKCSVVSVSSDEGQEDEREA